MLTNYTTGLFWVESRSTLSTHYIVLQDQSQGRSLYYISTLLLCFFCFLLLCSSWNFSFYFFCILSLSFDDISCFVYFSQFSFPNSEMHVYIEIEICIEICFIFYFCWYKKEYNNFKYFHISSENINTKHSW